MQLVKKPCQKNEVHQQYQYYKNLFSVLQKKATKMIMNNSLKIT